MKIVSLCCLSILLFSCSTGTAGPPKLPGSASFGWQLKGIRETVPGRQWRAEYGGPGTAEVDIYSVQSAAEALDRTQKWRPAAQTVTAFNDHYFLVIRWQGADRAAATALVGQIERSLPRSD